MNEGVVGRAPSGYSARVQRFHVAVGVSDIVRSVEDYSRRLGARPVVVVPGEYALWRTSTLNFSIRRTTEAAGALRHFGWEDDDASSFTTETDVNGIVWERFAASDQDREIEETWPGTITSGTNVHR